MIVLWIVGITIILSRLFEIGHTRAFDYCISADNIDF
jgi:hypothetical protein